MVWFIPANAMNKLEIGWTNTRQNLFSQEMALIDTGFTIAISLPKAVYDPSWTDNKYIYMKMPLN